MISTVPPVSPPSALPPRRSSRSFEEPVQIKGVRHAGTRLDGKQYKSQSFVLLLLDCLRALRVPQWSAPELQPSSVSIRRVSGALTNLIFVVCGTSRRCPPLLLRIYGSSSASLISRPRELHTLHVLSSQYHIGPKIYGTFENGRVEEYFEANPLTPSELRDPTISRWIGVRMAEFHKVDIERVEGNVWDIGVKSNVKSWLPAAERVLALSTMSQTAQRHIDLPAFKKEWEKYMIWLSAVDDVHSGSKRVFAHNDTQYGNILRLRNSKAVGHHQLVVVDFEYASPDPASYDIANHFHEWTAAYHSSTPYLLDTSRYPTVEQRRNFYTAYLGHTDASSTERERQLADLDKQVSAWSPASHGMWGIWGIVQAREDVQQNIQVPDFDYIRYAICRLTLFRQAIRALGI